MLPAQVIDGDRVMTPVRLRPQLAKTVKEKKAVAATTGGEKLGKTVKET